MKKLTAILFASVLMLFSVGTMADDSSTSGDSKAECNGQTFNPMSDVDWNNMYPITVMGVRSGANESPPLMYEPAVCECPGVIFDIPSIGYGLTYFQPLYLVEVERKAGCFESLGGENIGGGGKYGALNSEQVNNNGDLDSTTSRMQVHWMEYPVFALMHMFASTGCFNGSGFDIGYITEYDYFWQSDEAGILFSPEASLFTDPILQASCAIDAAAASFGFPLDVMFWCQGSWGGTYPLTGNSQHGNSPFQLNNSIMGKFIARQARLGMQFTTIGPTAECFAHPMPIWIKSQYRVNQVAPIPRRGGTPLSIGGTEAGQFPLQTNYPSKESTVNLLWQGQQCCVRLY